MTAESVAVRSVRMKARLLWRAVLQRFDAGWLADAMEIEQPVSS